MHPSASSLHILARLVATDRATVLELVSAALHEPACQRNIDALLSVRAEFAQTLHLIDTLMPVEALGRIAPRPQPFCTAAETAAA